MGGALTGIWARSLTTDDILEALRAHRCYATTGRRIVLDFRVNGLPMGSVIRSHVGASLSFTVSVSAAVPISRIELIRDGKIAQTWIPKPKDLPARNPTVQEVTERTAQWREEGRPGSHFYYVKVILAEPDPSPMPANLQPRLGNRAWSSPVWFGRSAQ